MFREWIKRQKDFYYGDAGSEGQKLFSFGGLEIALIVIAVILVFGVGKLGNVGGALGKSIREFRRERDKIDDVPKLKTRDTKEENSSQKKIESKEEGKS